MLKYHIQTIEAGSAGTASFVFSNIPSSYTDLYILLSLRTNRNATYDDFRIVLNSTNGTSRILYGDGTNRGAFTQPTILTSGGAAGNNTTANTFGNSSVYISDYASTTRFKAISMDGVQEHNATTAYQSINAGFWSSTAAVTEVTVLPGDGTLLLQYSSASLYGIKRGSDGKTEVASGGTITTSGGYTIHTFNSSGTFVANRDMDVEYLVIGGGAGGGFNLGGGGGAGGYRCSVVGESSGGGASAEAKLRVSSGISYSIVVGAGGTGAATTILAASGSNSIFGSIIALGGGGGAGENVSPGGAVGGSGGGASYSWTGGAGTTGQGYGGGNPMSPVANPVGGGGGGGAGQAGANAIPSYAGNGGNGVSSSITGSAIARAGGGGGGELFTGIAAGAGGNGGGAAGGFNTQTGFSASANTGGGGGGGGQASGGSGRAGGNGGSGVVIIRYLTPA